MFPYTLFSPTFHRDVSNTIGDLLRCSGTEAQAAVNLHRIGRGMDSYRPIAPVHQKPAEKSFPHALSVSGRVNKKQRNVRTVLADGQYPQEDLSIQSTVNLQS